MKQKDDMDLPEGFSCGDCQFAARCKMLLAPSFREEGTRCDWAPARFRVSVQQALEWKQKASKEWRQGKAVAIARAFNEAAGIKDEAKIAMLAGAVLETLEEEQESQSGVAADLPTAVHKI